MSGINQQEEEEKQQERAGYVEGSNNIDNMGDDTTPETPGVADSRNTIESCTDSGSELGSGSAASGSEGSEGSGTGSFGGGANTKKEISSRDWGWFEEDVPDGTENEHSNGRHQSQDPLMTDVSGSMRINSHLNQSHSQPIMRPRDVDSAAAMAVTAPNYILEESLSVQELWKDSAGTRPPQPVEERAFYEKLWAQNFTRSKVNYQMPIEVLTATSPISLSPFADGMLETGARVNLDNYDINSQSIEAQNTSRAHNPSSSRIPIFFWNDHRRNNDGLWEPYRHQHIVNTTIKKTDDGDSLTVLVRGDNVFGTTVSKSFARDGNESDSILTEIDTVNISIASYRVVQSRKHGKYAQFLVIYREGSIRDTVGVWKRYSDFRELIKKVTPTTDGCASVISTMSPLAMTEEYEIEHLPNVITSWRLIQKRQRWYRCLDAGYLSLKVFLLERFLHDILFESSSPKILRDFVGVAKVNTESASGGSAHSTLIF